MQSLVAGIITYLMVQVIILVLVICHLFELIDELKYSYRRLQNDVYNLNSNFEAWRPAIKQSSFTDKKVNALLEHLNLSAIYRDAKTEPDKYQIIDLKKR